LDNIFFIIISVLRNRKKM